MKTHQLRHARPRAPDIIPVPRALILDPRLSHSDRLVYGQLLNEALGHSSCNVFHRDLVPKLGLKIQVISMAIKHLKAFGYLSVRHSPAGIPSTYSFLPYPGPSQSKP